MVENRPRNRAPAFLLRWLPAVAACWCLVAPDALAIDTKLRAKATQAAKILREKSLAAASDKQALDDFFKKDFLPLFAQERDDLPKVRKDLRIMLGQGKSGDAHTRVNELTFAKMSDLVKNGKPGPYDAAIRYNALLVIGDLNETEADAGKPAKPLPAALPVLMDQLQSKDSPDYMKLAAMLGLERTAQAGGIPQAKAAELTKTLLEIVNQQDPPAGREQRAHNFMRRDAAAVLAAMGSPGPDNAVLKAFESLATDPKLRPTVRCDMAQFIGQIKYPAAAKVDLNHLASLLGEQWIELCKHEIETAEADGRDPSRRLIAYSTFCTNAGLSGLKAAASAGNSSGDKTADTELVDRMKAKLKSVYTDLDNSDLTDSEIADKVTERIADVESLLEAKSARKEVAGRK